MKYIFIVYLFDTLDANILLYNVHQMISFSELTQPTEKSGGESPSKFVSLSLSLGLPGLALEGS